MNIPDKAIIAAARAHYVYVWHSVDCDADAAAARWDGGEVEGDVMAYHGNHVRHQIEAAAPFVAAEALRDRANTIKLTAPDDGMVHVDYIVENTRDMADFLDPQ